MGKGEEDTMYTTIENLHQVQAENGLQGKEENNNNTKVSRF